MGSSIRPLYNRSGGAGVAKIKNEQFVVSGIQAGINRDAAAYILHQGGECRHIHYQQGNEENNLHPALAPGSKQDRQLPIID